jgi:predicted membrane-bound spermidine synthase
MPDQAAPRPLPLAVLYPVFFLSGAAAILYQLVWQRSLFTLYGTSSESVTVVVTAFMLGLGLGGLAGGWVSGRPGLSLPAIFGLVELAIGLFGLISLPFFRWIASWTAESTGIGVGFAALGAVVVPTLLMGATLPLLIAHRVRESGNVGQSVGELYFVNTLGSAVGAFLAAVLLMGALGQSGSVRVAAVLNLLVAAVVLGCSRWGSRR